MFPSARPPLRWTPLPIPWMDFIQPGWLAETWRPIGRGARRMPKLALQVDVIPPAQPARRELPITAHIQGKYRGINDSLELAQFSAFYARFQDRMRGNTRVFLQAASLSFNLQSGRMAAFGKGLGRAHGPAVSSEWQRDFQWSRRRNVFLTEDRWNAGRGGLRVYGPSHRRALPKRPYIGTLWGRAWISPHVTFCCVAAACGEVTPAPILSSARACRMEN